MEPSDEEAVLMKPYTKHADDDSLSLEMEGIRPSVDMSRSSSSSSEQTSALLPSGISTPHLEPPSYVSYTTRSRSGSAPETPLLPNDLEEIDLSSRFASESRSSIDTIPAGQEFSSLYNMSSRGHRSTASLDTGMLSTRPNSSTASSTSRIRSMFRSRGPAASSNILPLHTSSRSASSLNISAPLQDTLVASSQNYVYPRAGLTAQQMSFLSSRESLSLIGIGPYSTSNDPPAFDEQEAHAPDALPLPVSPAPPLTPPDSTQNSPELGSTEHVSRSATPLPASIALPPTPPDSPVQLRSHDLSGTASQQPLDSDSVTQETLNATETPDIRITSPTEAEGLSPAALRKHFARSMSESSVSSFATAESEADSEATFETAR